jgi:protocatechuate 3,4-dioxygenase beta subunit
MKVVIRFARIMLASAIFWHGLSAAQIPNPAPQPTAATYRIAGTVVNTIGGSPLARTLVTIRDVRNTKDFQWTVTSENGHFEFQRVNAAKYGMTGVKKGFIPAAYEQHEQYATAIVTGADVDTEHLILRLAPLAVLSGKVLDDVGEPVRQASIALYTENRRLGIDRVERASNDITDDQGFYEFTALTAGTYFLSVTANPWYALHPASSSQPNAPDITTSFDRSLDVAYLATYYKDTTDADDALPIPIRGGDRVEADIHLAPVPALHVLFNAPDNGQYGFPTPSLHRPTLDGEEYVQGLVTAMVSPGVYELTGVPAGRYTFRTGVSSPSGVVQNRDMEVDLTLDGQEVDGTKGEPTSSVKASVRIVGEDNPPTQISIRLRNSKLRVVGAQIVDQKGEVEFKDLTPSRYEVLAQGPRNAYSITSISGEDKTRPGHFLDVGAGSSLAVSLSVVEGSTTVEGFAKRSGKAAAGVMVVLVPQNPEANRELFRRDQSDLDGSFSLPNVIPGTYTACAIEDGWDLDWSTLGVITPYCERGSQKIVIEKKEGTVRLDAPVEVHPK